MTLHNPALTDWEADVLRHTSNNGRYVTGEERVIELASRGLLFDHGPQRLAGGMHYLVMTPEGRRQLNLWQAAQPKPKARKRRVSRQFRAWRDYVDANGYRKFPDFLTNVWPECKHWPCYQS